MRFLSNCPQPNQKEFVLTNFGRLSAVNQHNTTPIMLVLSDDVYSTRMMYKMTQMSCVYLPIGDRFIQRCQKLKSI